jgi:polyisoprenoid-binding protein YceI
VFTQIRAGPRRRSTLAFRATSRVVNADGRFHRFGGHVSVDPRDPTTARISITIETASIDTANTRRDNHLRDPDFFWTERTDYEISYQSLLNPVADVVRVRFVFRGSREGP